MSRTRTLRSKEQELAAYNDLTPEGFGARVGGLTAESVCALIRDGDIAALDLSMGKSRPTYAIPESEVERFRRARMLNAHLLEPTS